MSFFNNFHIIYIFQYSPHNLSLALTIIVIDTLLITYSLNRCLNMTVMTHFTTLQRQQMSRLQFPPLPCTRWRQLCGERAYRSFITFIVVVISTDRHGNSPSRLFTLLPPGPLATFPPSSPLTAWLQFALYAQQAKQHFRCLLKIKLDSVCRAH